MDLKFSFLVGNRLGFETIEIDTIKEPKRKEEAKAILAAASCLTDFCEYRYMKLIRKNAKKYSEKPVIKNLTLDSIDFRDENSDLMEGK